jgi:hypothetical protein
MNRRKITHYVFSLPERVVRSLSAITAGAVREIGDVVLPARVRRSKLYDSLVESTMRFLIEQVGQVEIEHPRGPLPDQFLVRRAAGNVVEIAGLIAFRASPVWVFAALADMAGAGRDLIGEIARALQKEGLLEQGRKFENVDQMLDGLERTSGRLAEAVNTPPLNIAALREEWEKLRRDASRIPRAVLPSRERLWTQWRELKQEASEQGRSVLELSSLLAVAAVRKLPENTRWLSNVARTGTLRTGEVLARGLLDHYRTTLSEIHQTGYVRYWLRELGPYLRGAARQFSPERISTTERLLTRRRAGRPDRASP